jgi:hypothetical protein
MDFFSIHLARNMAKTLGFVDVEVFTMPNSS